MQRGQVKAGCLVESHDLNATPEEGKSCFQNGHLLLACGKKVPLLSNACIEPLTGVRSKMPVVKGKVGDDVLRGCSGVVVKKDLVGEDQFTGDLNIMLLIDNTARKVPIARIYVDTPYLKGHVEVQCLSDPINDLIIGNVHDARGAQNPDPSWQEACAVTARSQAKKKDGCIALKVPCSCESPIVDREKLKQMQREDESLRKYWD